METCLLLACLPNGSLAADNVSADWPQFLGPTRNGLYSGPALATTWPKEGPTKIWEKQTGQGFSGPVVSAGKLVLFHRLADKETVECLQAANGKILWTSDYPTGFRDLIRSEEDRKSVV